jgi:hypothetical protein
MKRKIVISIVLGLAVATAAPATAAIKIIRIHFDPPGEDDGSAGSLNQEYIVIKNTVESKRSITGWRIHDAGRDHVYVFGQTPLEPGECAVLRTGVGGDGRSLGGMPKCVGQRDRHWDLDNYVWNNDGDKATLKNASKKVRDACGYTASADSPKPC